MRFSALLVLLVATNGKLNVKSNYKLDAATPRDGPAVFVFIFVFVFVAVAVFVVVFVVVSVFVFVQTRCQEINLQIRRQSLRWS